MEKKVIFTTWNAQGGVIEDQEKLQVIKELVADYKHHSASHIFAIQEAGSDPQLYSELGGIPYKQFWCEPDGTNYLRCTLGILAPKSLQSDFYWINAGIKRKIPSLCLDNCIQLGCMHAVSSPLAPNEVQAAITQLSLNNKLYILGGDMNSTPPAEQGFKVFNCGHPTHNGGKELDYFIACTAVRYGDVSVKNVGPSDHDPVTAVFEFWR